MREINVDESRVSYDYGNHKEISFLIIDVIQIAKKTFENKKLNNK